LTTFSVVGSQSRGALLGGIAAAGFMWTKTKNKIISGAALVFLLAAVAAFMPQSWYDRMATIQTYSANEDTTNNRLFLWETGWKIALARPLTGAGFYSPYERAVVAEYAPGGTARALHSIWFETLAEHGFPTFFVWLAFPIFGWLNARYIIKAASTNKDLQWAADLARMGQVSIVAFLVSGTFLSLMYYDVYFTIVIAIAATRILVEKQTAESAVLSAVPPWRGILRSPVQQPGLVRNWAARSTNS
jgi:putative inorganic carbon (hco3(-)) transporter